jgi:antirestriction protein ArdC
VRKGERGTTVVYADRFVPDDQRQRADERGEQPRGIPFLKRFTVFNVEQCAALPDGIAAPPPALDASLILPQVEELIRATQSPRGRGGRRSCVTDPMRLGERLPARPSRRTNRRPSHGQVAIQDRLERIP